MTTTTQVKLTVADRCDRCHAQAYVKAEKDGLELLFCAHHSREALLKLKASGFVITDETERLVSDGQADDRR